MRKHPILSGTVNLLLVQERFLKARHDVRIIAVGKHVVDSDALQRQNWRHHPGILQRARLCGAVLGKVDDWVDRRHAASHDDLAPLGLGRVVPHVMHRELGAVDDTFKVNIRAAEVRLGRDVVDRGILAVEIVAGATVDDARVGNEDVKAVPFVPCRLEEVGLGFVRDDVALDEYGCLAGRI